MEKEVSHAVEIGVTLAVVSILITVVFLTVTIGGVLKDDAYANATRVTTEMSEGVLRDLVGEESKMPMAAAYNLLRTYSKYIPKVTYKGGKGEVDRVQDLTRETPSLVNSMQGRVILEVALVEDWYEVVVHKDGCTWFYGVCTCTEKD